jgi:predicted CoA-binding protein
VEDAIAAGAKNIWAQLGVYDDEIGRKARQAGLGVVMDQCILVEHRRLVRN